MEKCQYYKAVQGLFDVSIFTGKPHIRERIEYGEVRANASSEAAPAIQAFGTIPAVRGR